MPALKKERIINCLDCGVEVATRSVRTQRCKECAAKRLSIKRKEACERQNEKRKKERCENVERFSYQFCDSPENIQKCLNCQKPKCGNCLGTTGARRRYMQKKEMLKNAKNGNQSTTVCASP